MSKVEMNDAALEDRHPDQEVGAYGDEEGADEVWREETLLEHVARVARARPASAALMAAGLAWIVFGRTRNVARGVNAAGTAVGEAARAAASSASQAAQAVGEVVATGAESAQRAGKAVARTVRAGVGATTKSAKKSVTRAAREASQTQDDLESTFQRTGSVLSQAGQGLVDTLSGGAATVRRGGERARHAAIDLAQNQPILLNALCLAAGAGAAALVPRTQRETELLGGYRDEAVRAARQGAASLVAGGLRTARAKTSQAVQEAARKAAEEAAERVLRQADSIGDVVLDTLQKVTGGPTGTGMDSLQATTASERAT